MNNWKRITVAGVVAGMVAVTGCAGNVPDRNHGNRNGERLSRSINRNVDDAAVGRTRFSENTYRNRNVARESNMEQQSTVATRNRAAHAPSRGVTTRNHTTDTQRAALRPTTAVGHAAPRGAAARTTPIARTAPNRHQQTGNHVVARGTHTGSATIAPAHGNVTRATRNVAAHANPVQATQKVTKAPTRSHQKPATAKHVQAAPTKAPTRTTAKAIAAKHNATQTQPAATFGSTAITGLNTGTSVANNTLRTQTPAVSNRVANTGLHAGTGLTNTLHTQTPVAGTRSANTGLNAGTGLTNTLHTQTPAGFNRSMPTGRNMQYNPYPATGQRVNNQGINRTNASTGLGAGQSLNGTTLRGNIVGNQMSRNTMNNESNGQTVMTAATNKSTTRNSKKATRAAKYTRKAKNTRSTRNANSTNNIKTKQARVVDIDTIINALENVRDNKSMNVSRTRSVGRNQRNTNRVEIPSSNRDYSSYRFAGSRYAMTSADSAAQSTFATANSYNTAATVAPAATATVAPTTTHSTVSPTATVAPATTTHSGTTTHGTTTTNSGTAVPNGATTTHGATSISFTAPSVYGK